MSAPSIALKANKRALRKAITATLKTLSPSAIEEQSHSVHTQILALPSFRACKSISCYLSMPAGELDTSALVREILQLGKTLYVPKIDITISAPASDSHLDKTSTNTSTNTNTNTNTNTDSMRFLRIHDLADLDALPAGLWGIPDPPEMYEGALRRDVLAEDAEDLDMILVPGVAFDRAGNRLGHGKGYYDRFIAAYVASGRPRPVLVALSLREQLLAPDAAVPVGEFDWTMDVIVSPDEVIRIFVD